jgi:TolB-like protein
MKNNQYIPKHFYSVLLCFNALFYCHGTLANTLSGVAQIELCTGEMQLVKLDKTTHVDNVLLPGDSIQTSDNPGSRCRIALPNGNAIHIGSATKVKFDNNQQITLIQGQLLAYAMPTLEQQEQPIMLQVGNGVLTLFMGKIFAKSVNEQRQIAVFNDLVSAVWQDNQGNKTLYPGNLFNISSGNLDITQIPQGMDAEVSEQLSPETPAVLRATQAFKNKDLATSGTLFKQIQHAFPYNAAAAYHLGLFELKDNKVAEAVVQWKNYAEIDPEGAQKNGVTKQLTLMNTKAIRDEVKVLIAKEKTLSQEQPEPNSIAVHPLINKGAERYQPIGKGLTAFVISDLMKVPGLKVLEREKLQTLIDEIKLSESGGLVEKNSRVRAGRIMRAEKLMIGDYLIESSKGAK